MRLLETAFEAADDGSKTPGSPNRNATQRVRMSRFRRGPRSRWVFAERSTGVGARRNQSLSIVVVSSCSTRQDGKLSLHSTLLD